MRLARLTVAFVLISTASAAAQAPLKHLPSDDSMHRQPPVDHAFHGCPIGGKSSGPHPGGGVFDADLNALKNRVNQSPSYLDIKSTAILELASPVTLKGTLRSSWLTDSLEDAEIVASYEGLPVSMEGYLVVDKRYNPIKYAAQEEGPESTNCGAVIHKGDVHVWVTSKKNQNMTRAIVVELTPRVREALGQDSSRVQAQKLVAAARRGLRVRVSGWLMFDEDHPEQLRDRMVGGTLYRQRRATLWEIHPVIKFEIQDQGGWQDLSDWIP
jgi:hypothetical protein